MLVVMSEPGEKKKRATYQDVLDAPEHVVAEIINGDLRLSPRPRPAHAVVSSTLGGELGPPFSRGRGGPGGWIILDEPELHFGNEIVVPDLAGWRRERLPFVPEEAYFTLPPDWLCEVLAKSTEKMDRVEKMPIYAAAGVRFAWIIDPRLRTLEAYELRDGTWSAIGAYKDFDKARIAPFDAIELDLAVLWEDMPLPIRASEGAAQYEW